jgi:hypothetical protein
MYVFGLLALAASVSTASARELTLTLGGDAYAGLPHYEVVADDELVGEGDVSVASGQVVTVDIGNAKTLAIRFTNDAAGPRGADGVRPPGTDRNLIIEKVVIDGTDIPLADMPKGTGLILQPTRLVIANSQSVAVPLDSLPPVAETAPTEPAAAPAAEAPVAAEAEAPPAPVCTLPAVEISGYANGVVEPPAEALKALLATAIPPGCLITITGYSSSSGSADLNLSMADQRASAVHDKLAAAGVDAADMEVVAFGATTQFGPKQADNRRVVVSFAPKN